MPLQNRVDLFGATHVVSERGLFTGNRGIIHDPETRTLLKKRWTLPAWIICACEFRDWWRVPMGRNRPSGKAGWTELFCLDEVTGLAVGHRPCFFRRRQQAIGASRALMVDKRLHKERIAASGHPPAVTLPELGGLPNGAMVADASNIYALRAGKALEWSFAGYFKPDAFDHLGGRSLRLATLPTTIALLRQGFTPVWHLSADTPCRP